MTTRRLPRSVATLASAARHRTLVAGVDPRPGQAVLETDLVPGQEGR